MKLLHTMFKITIKHQSSVDWGKTLQLHHLFSICQHKPFYQFVQCHKSLPHDILSKETIKRPPSNCISSSYSNKKKKKTNSRAMIHPDASNHHHHHFGICPLLQAPMLQSLAASGFLIVSCEYRRREWPMHLEAQGKVLPLSMAMVI